MDPSTVTYIWLFAGIALAISEIVVPGGIVIFLGAAAMLVAGLRGLGLVEALLPSLALWIALSAGLVCGAGRFLKKRFQSERTVALTDEDASAFGQFAEVVDPIQADEAIGRIRFQGTTWSARSVKGALPAGCLVRLVDRDNLCWIVEPATAPLESNPRADRAAARPQLADGATPEDSERD